MPRRITTLLLGLAAVLVLTTAPARAADPIPVTGVDTRLALDPGAAAALTSLGVYARPTTAATVDDDGRFVFPVTGGELTPALAGTVTHTGGIYLRKGGRFTVPINVQNFTIDLTGDPKLTAELRGTGIRFDLARLTNIAVAPGDGGATVVTADVELTGFTASVLNFAFRTRALSAGFKLGTATATVTLGSASS